MKNWKETILKNIEEKWPILLACSFVIIGYLYLTTTGNRFCDCAPTESYESSSSSSYARSRFYHK